MTSRPSRRRNASPTVDSGNEAVESSPKRTRREDAKSILPATFSWEDAFATDLGPDWQMAFQTETKDGEAASVLSGTPSKYQAQLNWVRQLSGTLLVLPEEKAWMRISRETKFPEKFTACVAIYPHHLKIVDCLLRSCLPGNGAKTVNPLAKGPRSDKESVAQGINSGRKKTGDGVASGSVSSNMICSIQSAFLHLAGGLTIPVLKSTPFAIGRSYPKDEPDSQILSLNLKNLTGYGQVSRKHATIIWREEISEDGRRFPVRAAAAKSLENPDAPGSWWFMDESKHGSMVDGSEIVSGGEVKLSHGSCIAIGGQEMVFFLKRA